MSAKLYQYAMVYHPLKTKKDEDEGKDPQSILIKEICSILANNEKEVVMKASREIPEQYLDKLSQIEVAIRPF